MKRQEVEVSRNRTVHLLKEWGIPVEFEGKPSPQHFGNWVLIGRDRNVAFRFVCDRGDLQLDLMPASVYKGPQSNAESDWYTWDVVASAANLPFGGKLDPLNWFFSYRDGVSRAFAPENLVRVKHRLADVEEEKRRRFTEGRRVRAHA